MKIIKILKENKQLKSKLDNIKPSVDELPKNNVQIMDRIQIVKDNRQTLN